MNNAKKQWEKIEHIVHGIFVKKIYPVWLRKREKFESFADWEDFCIKFNSLEFFPKGYHKIIFAVFGNERNLNYEYFWKLVGE